MKSMDMSHIYRSKVNLKNDIIISDNIIADSWFGFTTTLSCVRVTKDIIATL